MQNHGGHCKPSGMRGEYMVCSGLLTPHQMAEEVKARMYAGCCREC